MFTNIVIGVDGSEPSLKALRFACDLARAFNSDIHLVHTPQPQTVAFALGAVTGYRTATTMPSKREIDEASELIIDEGRKLAEEYELEVNSTCVELGDPAENIASFARQSGAELIVLGRRGLGNLSKFVPGSTNIRVAQKTKCACLSVP